MFRRSKAKFFVKYKVFFRNKKDGTKKGHKTDSFYTTEISKSRRDKEAKERFSFLCWRKGWQVSEVEELVFEPCNNSERKNYKI